MYHILWYLMVNNPNLFIFSSLGSFTCLSNSRNYLDCDIVLPYSASNLEYCYLFVDGLKLILINFKCFMRSNGSSKLRCLIQKWLASKSAQARLKLHLFACMHIVNCIVYILDDSSSLKDDVSRDDSEKHGPCWPNNKHSHAAPKQASL